MTSTSPSPSRPFLSLRTGPSPVDDEAAELLHEFVFSHPPTPIEDRPNLSTYGSSGVEIDKVALEAQRAERAARPWWRLASATW